MRPAPSVSRAAEATRPCRAVNWSTRRGDQDRRQPIGRHRLGRPICPHGSRGSWAASERTARCREGDRFSIPSAASANCLATSRHLSPMGTGSCHGDQTDLSGEAHPSCHRNLVSRNSRLQIFSSAGDVQIHEQTTPRFAIRTSRPTAEHFDTGLRRRCTSRRRGSVGDDDRITVAFPGTFTRATGRAVAHEKH